jgi:hypothetical protein
MTSHTRWIADINGAPLPPVQHIPQGKRGLKRGRPAKPGERYTCGRLKPVNEILRPSNEMAPALWQRIRAQAIHFGEDARLGSELSRLSMLGVLTGAETAAGMRMAEIYGQYERLEGKRRSTRSAAYDVGYGDGEIDEERLTEEERKIRVAREQTIIKTFTDLRDALAPRARDMLERLCVEDRRVDNVNIEEIKEMLAGLPAAFGKKWRDRKAGPVRPERARRPTEAAAHPARPVETVDLPAKTAHRMAMTRLRPDLDADQVDSAWTLQRELAITLAERERFRREKELRKSGAPPQNQ